MHIQVPLIITIARNCLSDTWYKSIWQSSYFFFQITDFFYSLGWINFSFFFFYTEKKVATTPLLHCRWLKLKITAKKKRQHVEEWDLGLNLCLRSCFSEVHSNHLKNFLIGLSQVLFLCMFYGMTEMFWFWKGKDFTTVYFERMPEEHCRASRVCSFVPNFSIISRSKWCY